MQRRLVDSNYALTSEGWEISNKYRRLVEELLASLPKDIELTDLYYALSPTTVPLQVAKKMLQQRFERQRSAYDMFHPY